MKKKTFVKVSHNKHGYGDRIHIPPQFGLGDSEYVELNKKYDKIIVSKIKE